MGVHVVSWLACLLRYWVWLNKICGCGLVLGKRGLSLVYIWAEYELSLAEPNLRGKKISVEISRFHTTCSWAEPNLRGKKMFFSGKLISTEIWLISTEIWNLDWNPEIWSEIQKSWQKSWEIQKCIWQSRAWFQNLVRYFISVRPLK